METYEEVDVQTHVLTSELDGMKKYAYTISVESLKETDHLEDQARMWG
jgi:hypothetical protein